MGNGAKGNYSAHEEGHNGSFFLKEKHVGFTIEVLQDQGMGSIGTVTKFCVIDATLKREGQTRVRDEMLYESVQGTIVFHRKTCKQV